MKAHPSIRHFPGLWLPNRKPMPQERVRFDPGFARELGLVGAWTFSQLAARDLSPYNRHATPVGSSIQLVSAQAGTGAWFTGDNSTGRLNLGSITSADPLSLAGLSTCTIAFRAYRATGAGNSFPRIIDKSSGGNALNGWGAWWSGDSYRFAADSSITAETAYSAADQWDSLAVRMNGGGASSSGQVHWFLNGADNGSSGDTGNTIPTSTTSAAIGNWNHSTDREWRGGIEYVYVFREALPDAILTNLQREPYRYLEPEPVAAVVFLPRTAAAPSGFQAAWARGSTVTIQPGIAA